jgi:predicted PurR-regulated permease PerM
MSESQRPTSSPLAVSNVIEIVVRLGVLALLIAWCFVIIAPFLDPVVWGVIIAVAVNRPFQRLEKLVGARSGLAATLFVLLALLLLIVPTAMLLDTLISGAHHAASALSAGAIKVPPPSAGVANWPLIGAKLYPLWQLASENLQQALNQILPHLKGLSRWLLSIAGSASFGVIQFVLSIIIAGVLLAGAEGGQRFAQTLATRLAGERGNALVALAGATVGNVAAGILGVALIQSVLAGLGFLAVDLPGAGLWALLVLLLAVVQLPIPLVLIPVIVYVFSSSSTLVAVLFLIWSVFISLLDNILKPILFGRGARVPTLVIFLGAIGGMLTSGIIGLFTGSVVLAVGYEIFRAWLYANTPEDTASSAEDGQVA